MSLYETSPMKIFIKSICRAVPDMCRDRSGLAFLEFALVLPILLLLLLGGIEVSRYIQVSQKADKLAHTIVDLVAQSPTISTQDLQQIMAAARHVMEPYNFTDDGTIIISCVGYNSNNELRVKWQYTGGGNLVRASRIGALDGAPALPAGFTVEAKDNVIISETFFSLAPMLNNHIVQPTEFYRTAYYLPRLGELDKLIVN
jgi:hypothetical protein